MERGWHLKMGGSKQTNKKKNTGRGNRKAKFVQVASSQEEAGGDGRMAVE